MKKDYVRMAALGALGAFSVLALMAQTPMAIQNDGVQFPDGTVQTTAAASDTRRGFYQTAFYWEGVSVLSACADGYHTASLWELLDVSNLRYAVEEGDAFVRDDSGQGPPTGSVGWVRTGWADTTGTTTPGLANCNGWSTSLDSESGTRVGLVNAWDGSGVAPAVDWLGPWQTGATTCGVASPVWCIED